MLIYLFRDERTDNRALTMDVTGRNIPPVTSSTVWLFVEAIDTHRLPPQWDTAYLRYAVRQARMTGFYLFEAGRVPLLQRKLVDALDFRTRRGQSPEGLAGKSACQPPPSRVLFGFGQILGILYDNVL